MRFSMATPTLSLDDDSTGTSVPVGFTLQESNSSGSTWLDDSRSVGFPRRLIITHTMKKPGAAGSDRHQILLQDIQPVSNGGSVISSTNIVVTVPRAELSTSPETQVLSLLSLAIDLLKSDGYAKAKLINRGGTP